MRWPRRRRDPGQAWRDAADDLDLEVVAPFTLEGTPYVYDGWVACFGSAQGTVLGSTSGYGNEGERAAAEDAGYYISWLNPMYYDRYNRERWVETLEDWGWWDKTRQPPAWYTPRHPM